jgi:hypothetical protein
MKVLRCRSVVVATGKAQKPVVDKELTQQLQQGYTGLVLNAKDVSNAAGKLMM